MKSTKGNRVADSADGLLSPGEYARIGGYWHGCTPNGYTANISGHKITEYDDGTISVSPSILVKGGDGRHLWHGHLERGVWTEC